ncbi:ribonuclease H-like domain-containing protein [Tanacetum coccineum]
MVQLQQMISIQGSILLSNLEISNMSRILTWLKRLRLSGSSREMRILLIFTLLLTEREGKLLSDGGVRPTIVSDSFLKLSPNQITSLDAPFSREEIKRVVWDCGSDKAPGPDGFTFGFFKRFREVIKEDVFAFVRSFQNRRVIPRGYNPSFIALIPKVNDLRFTSDFRPISLIGCQYKITGKLLANRLATVIDSIISPEQSAFIKGRQILDGPMMLNFLFEVMNKMGFTLNWFAWVKATLTSSRASVLLNGAPTEEFDVQRGLRQGDPLSSFLFVLDMEGFHVDDAILLCDWGIGVGLIEVQQVAEMIGCCAVRLPFIYLGVPMGCNMNRGLGVGSLAAFNKALLFKWKWRLRDTPNALWVRLVTSIHGEGGTRSSSRYGAMSPWVNIERAMKQLEVKGFHTDNFYRIKVGIGDKTSFWRDQWLGDRPLMEQFPRLFTLDPDPDAKVVERNSPEKLLAAFGREPRSAWGALQEFNFSEVPDRVTWNTLAPRKLNILLWRILRDKIPTRLNLSDKVCVELSILATTLKQARKIYIELGSTSDIRASRETLNDEIPPPPPPQKQTPIKQAPHIVSTIKLPILKKGEYDVLPPKTAEEILARERERKARTTLLMALPENHLAKFHKMTDAKEMWEAIKSRFGGNDESKKMQKYILKQQFKGFSISNSEGLHKGYDRFQSLLSQLEIRGAGVSTEDANQKFLRSLPSAWSQISLIMRTKPGVDNLSFDDLYNNLRVFEPDVKGSTASSSSTQNVAFVSENTSSTNKVSTDYGPQLDHEDLEQLDEFNLEEMDLKWQVAMIFMRLKKFYKKTGRKLQFDAKEPVGFDKAKVECYNCHKTGHFARECRSKGNQDSRRRDAGYTRYKAKDSGRRPGKQEEPKALVTLDGEGVDWTSHSEDEQENYALMAYSNSGSDTEVTSCSKECKESYAKLKKLYDEQREQLGDASIEIQAYTQALKKVEAQLVAHQQNQLWYEEKIRFMKIDLDDKTDVLTYHKKLLAEVKKEKEELKAKVEKWHNSSKNLNILLTSQMSARDKPRLGYGNQMNKGVLSYENEVF